MNRVEFGAYIGELKLLNTRKANLKNQLYSVENQIEEMFTKIKPFLDKFNEHNASYPLTFERTEEKYETSHENAARLSNVLKKTLRQESFYGGASSINIFSLWFEDHSKLPEIDTDNYERVRLRKYHSGDILDSGDPFYWIELRKVSGNTVKKKRFNIWYRYLPFFLSNGYLEPVIRAENYDEYESKKALDAYFEIANWMNTRDAKPFVAIDYVRQAFLSEDKSIRVTLDSDIKYYSIPESITGKNFDLSKFGFLGKEDISIIKFKYSSTLPPEIAALKEGLSAPRSKIRNALNLLEKRSPKKS